MIARAMLDACVLYPPSLRDLLMRAAVAGVYEPRWTEQIHDEWTRNVLADNTNVTPAQLSRTRRLMNQTISDSVVSDYEARIPTLSLPDINDRHVLAAAIEANAPLIVTFNLSDFPRVTLQAYGVRAIHPDNFLAGLFDENEASFLSAVQTHRASLHHPPKDTAGYVQTLDIPRYKISSKKTTRCSV